MGVTRSREEQSNSQVSVFLLLLSRLARSISRGEGVPQMLQHMATTSRDLGVLLLSDVGDIQAR